MKHSMSEKPPSYDNLDETAWGTLGESSIAEKVDNVSEEPLTQSSTEPQLNLSEIRQQVHDVYRRLDSESLKTPEEEIHKERFLDTLMPQEYLGEDLICIHNLERRFGLNFSGKRHDYEELQGLIGARQSSSSFSDRLANLSPTAAQLFVDDFVSGKDLLGSDKDPRIIQSLPLSAQEEIFASPNIIGYLGRASEFYDPDTESKEMASFARKTLAGVLYQKENALYQKGNASFQLSLDLYHEFKKIVSELRTQDFKEDFASLSSEERKEIFDTCIEKSFSPWDAASLFLDTDGFEEYSELLTTPQNLRDIRIHHLLAIDYDSLPPSIVEKLPEGSCELSKIIDNFLHPSEDVLQDYKRNFARDYDLLEQKYPLFCNFDLTKSQDILKIFEQRQGVCEEYRITDLRCLYDAITETSLMQQIIEAPIPSNNNQKNSVNLFLKDPDAFRATFGSVRSVDRLYSISDLLKQNIAEEFDREWYDEAKDKVFRYLFGCSPDEVSRKMVALGIAEPSFIEKRRYDDDPNMFYRYKGKIKLKLKDDNINRLGLSNDEKLLLLSTMQLLETNGKRFKSIIENVDNLPESQYDNLMQTLDKLREQKLAEINQNFPKYMEETVTANSRLVDNTDFGGKKIPIMEMQGGEWGMLVHRLNAIYNNKSTEDPAQWNDNQRVLKRGVDGNLSGYISTTFISNESIELAGGRGITGPNEIFYGFTKLGDNSIVSMAEYDTWTETDLDGKIVTKRQERLYSTPQELIEAQKKNNKKGYNEGALDRFSGDPDKYDGRLQPNYLVVFNGDKSSISDRVKRHAAYFGVPILMIDILKYKEK